MSNGRWGTKGAPQHLQIAAQPLAIQVPADAVGEPVQYIPQPPPSPTADSLLGQAKVRLQAIEEQLRHKAALEAEKAKLERMIAALEEK